MEIAGCRRARGGAPDRGQAVVGTVLALAVLAGLTLVVARVGAAVEDRARAVTAADAAALAGAAEGRAAAAALAVANGGRLVAYHVEGDTVAVVVQVGDRRADARARRDAVAPPATWTPPTRAPVVP